MPLSINVLHSGFCFASQKLATLDNEITQLLLASRLAFMYHSQEIFQAIESLNLPNTCPFASSPLPWMDCQWQKAGKDCIRIPYPLSQALTSLHVSDGTENMVSGHLFKVFQRRHITALVW